jgi:AraC family transcriptional regulator
VRIGLVYMRPTQVAFVRSRGPYKTSTEQAWSMMDDWIDRHALKSSISCGFGLALDNPSAVDEKAIRYDACVKLPEGYENLKTDALAFQKLPGGAFARVRHVGDYGAIRESVALVRDKWLPDQTNLMLDPGRPFMFIYLDDPLKKDAAKLRSDVCIPVKTRHEDAMVRPRKATAKAA